VRKGIDKRTIAKKSLSASPYLPLKRENKKRNKKALL
jgi:hypothetical protein